MAATLSIILSVIFILLSIIHIYWLAGGQWGLKKAIPTKSENADFRPPPKLATLIVAIALALFGLIYLVRLEPVNIPFPNGLLHYGHWMIPSIFILRAIGEFKYVGVFKKIRNTEFAKADTKWFSPLCLGIGIMGMMLQIMQ